MIESPLPTIQEIDELLWFLPRLYDETYEPVVSWHGGTPDNEGVYSFPFPKYDRMTEDFFRIVSKACWSDYGYDPSQVYGLLMDHSFISKCSLEQIKTLLTYCVRGERFGDGHWEVMIKDGHILRILQRLTELRESIA